jgi:uncharacterized protein
MENNHIHSQPGKFYIKNESMLIGEIDYYTDEKNRIVVTHTFVDPSMRGLGIANQLMDKVIQLAEANKQYIYPICSFAVKVLQNNRYKHLWDPAEGEPSGGACTWMPKQ